ncbi:Rec domain [Halanaeroarchaeum sp. HSR-CO]|uniref:PAS domain S-box protein n=1 Tax=Halanaeroarchaeum sp. HSR-CO TaxID=2866382 RepID=UPI00217E1604|nr:PAS domain S-box protein [Halanaeroarchaeum sp. HSR-CO]UWG46701.1 Rec domain [Halanaeroarchaeum sp. HSR-CO]
MEPQDVFRVLVATADRDIAESTAARLRDQDARLDVTAVKGMDAARERLRQTTVDCVVSGHDPPAFDALGFLEDLRGTHPDLPVVVFPEDGSAELAGDVVAAGAVGYAPRTPDSASFDRLASRVIAAVEETNGSEPSENDARAAGLESELAALSVELLGRTDEDVDDRIDAALARIGSAAGADRSYLFRIDPDSETLSNTHEWAAPDVEPQIDRLQDLSVDTFPWWIDRLETADKIAIPDVAALPGDADAERELLAEQDVGSVVVTPIRREGELIGFVGFDWTEPRASFPPSFVDALRLVGELLASVLEHRRRRRELERREAYLQESGDIVSVMDPDGTVRFQSGSTEDVTAFSPAEVMGDSGFDHVHPDDREAIVNEFGSFVTKPNAEVTAEVRVRTSEGDWRWLEVRGVNKLEDPLIDGLVFSSRDITARKEREQELETVKQRLELAIAAADIGIWDWDMRTDEVQFTDRWATMLGYDPGAIDDSLTTWLDRLHPEDRDAVMAALEAHIEGETDYYETEHRMRTADGDWRWIRDLGRVVERDGDEPVRAVGMHFDVHERKERERELAEFREIVERTAHAVYITDDEGRIEYVNPAFEHITGYDEREAVGRTPRILKSGEYDMDYYEAFWEAILDGQRWEAEMIDERADDERIVLNQTISPITDRHGEVVKFVAVAQDISERKAYERELERTRADLRTIIDLVPDLIFAKNREGEYLFANEATAEAYGLTPEELEGTQESAVIPNEEDSSQFREDDLAVIESGEPTTIQAEELTTADGDTRILQTTKIPFEISQTGEDAVLGYARDVTELKEYERELETQRDNLEVLSQVVRHDIRNDLQLVLAYGEMLRSTVDGEEEESVVQILEAARNAVTITTTAREVADVMLQSAADRSPRRLQHALEEAVSDARSTNQHALLRVDGPIPDVTVPADDMLGSVFRNLLNNAITHNDKPVPAVTVDAAVDDDRVRVRVADNGPGIPDERKATIFEEGERGLDSEGTGLGLYLVATLVDRYDGSVTVEDHDPEGAVFVVELPLAE